MSESRMTLMATWSMSSVSRARKTDAVAPEPSSRSNTKRSAMHTPGPSEAGEAAEEAGGGE